MLTKKKIVVILLCAVILAMGVFVWHKSAVLPAVQKSGTGQPKKEQITDESVSASVKTYSDTALGFSFEYPDNFKLKASVAGDQDSITVNGEDGKNGFQILIGDYAEKDSLSLAAIKTDAGGLAVADGKEITVGQKNEIPAFAFTLKNPDADAGDVSADLAEIWFVRSGKLYQISSYAGFASDMGKIVGSFRFE